MSLRTRLYVGCAAILLVWLVPTAYSLTRIHELRDIAFALRDRQAASVLAVRTPRGSLADLEGGGRKCWGGRQADADAARARRISRAAGRWMWAATAAGASLLLLLAVSWFRALAVPLRRLRVAMSGVAGEHIVPPPDLPYGSRGELGELSRSFRAMAERLHELSRLKAGFIGIASHELKAPLSVIQGYVEMVQDGAYGPVAARQEEVLVRIREQIERLTERVDQLLSLSHVEALKAAIRPSETRLSDLLDGVRRDFEPIARRRRIRFTVAADETAPAWVWLDADRIRGELLGNLLANAFRFVSATGRVEVRAGREGDRLVLWVSDDGSGIPPEHLPYIFETYYRAGQRAGKVGAGLGLAIARRIVNAHGGQVTVNSRIGATTFRVELPLSGPSGARRAGGANRPGPNGQRVGKAASRRRSGRKVLRSLGGLTLLVPGWLLLAASPAESQPRLRTRDVGLAIGRLPTGHWDAITDVEGVAVGHLTLILGDSIRTGVTAVLPHRGNLFRHKVPAAIAVGNGFGKLVGLSQVNELGEIETPILLTGTLSVFRAADALVDTLLLIPGNREVRSINPVVGETNDGYLSDIRARPIQPEHVRAALRAARSGPVKEGSVGAGTGTRALGWKGGIGTASRRVRVNGSEYTVGVLVQTNYGGHLRIDGVPVGALLEARDAEGNGPASEGRSAGPGPGVAGEPDGVTDSDPRAGSVMIVVATDAPLVHRELQRVAVRTFLGVARTGSHMAHGSGDYAIAFSTVREGAPRRDGALLSALFEATVEATEEAVLNSLFEATTVRGYRGHEAIALPLEPTLKILRRYGRLGGADESRGRETPPRSS
ncbi:MAG: P1 family peptidase [Gemmatimonadota bacterium]